MNNKAEKEVVDCYNNLLAEIESQSKNIMNVCKNEIKNQLVEENKTFEKMIRENKTALLRIVRKESADLVNKVIKESLFVPGLIGDGQKYTSLQHCLLDMD